MKIAKTWRLKKRGSGWQVMEAGAMLAWCEKRGDAMRALVRCLALRSSPRVSVYIHHANGRVKEMRCLPDDEIPERWLTES